jgi:hypothetical protein
MTRSIIFILGLSVAAAFPAAASANCGSVAGPYSVTCEQGVQVYRHNALSGIPHRLTQAEAAVQTAEIRAETDRLRIAADERANRRASDLRAREIREENFRNRIINRDSRPFPQTFGIYSSRGLGLRGSLRSRSAFKPLDY